MSRLSVLAAVIANLPPGEQDVAREILGEPRPEKRTILQSESIELSEIVDTAEEALLDAGEPIYQRGGVLFWPKRLDENDDDDGVRRPASALVLERLREHWLLELMSRTANWLKPCNKEQVEAHPQWKYAKHLLGRPSWRFPVLRGVTTAPTIARDGRVIQRPGYDVQSGLLLEFEQGAFPRVCRSVHPRATRRRPSSA